MRYIKLFENFYEPPTYIKDKLNKMVKDSLKKYGGGKLFFDDIDNSIKDIANKDMILSLVRGNENEWIVSSGGFGDTLYKLYESGDLKCKGMVVFNGKMLTKNKGVTSYYPYMDIKDMEFIFVDDSLFSGGTFKKIEDFLDGYGSSIKEVLVIYDGSKNKSIKIKSFFRYYD